MITPICMLSMGDFSSCIFHIRVSTCSEIPSASANCSLPLTCLTDLMCSSIVLFLSDNSSRQPEQKKLSVAHCERLLCVILYSF